MITHCALWSYLFWLPPSVQYSTSLSLDNCRGYYTITTVERRDFIHSLNFHWCSCCLIVQFNLLLQSYYSWHLSQSMLWYKNRRISTENLSYRKSEQWIWSCSVILFIVCVYVCVWLSHSLSVVPYTSDDLWPNWQQKCVIWRNSQWCVF